MISNWKKTFGRDVFYKLIQRFKVYKIPEYNIAN